MATIDNTTGRGDLRAAEGDWLLAFHVGPNSGYKERPAVTTATVGVGETDVNVHLNVVKAAAVVTGTVLAPDGTPECASVDSFFDVIYEIDFTNHTDGDVVVTAVAQEVGDIAK